MCNISGPDQHDFGDASGEKVNLNGGRLKMESGNGGGKGQE